MNNLIKYRNCDPWLNPLKDHDKSLFDSVYKIHEAICLCDDVVDRAVKPEFALEAIFKAMKGISSLDSELKEEIMIIMEEMFEAQLVDINFVPGKLDVEEDLKIWETRSTMLDLYLWSLSKVYGDGLLNNDNINWFKKYKKYCLIYNDCMDILSCQFEDLVLPRRNYVILNKFGSDGYINWKNKIPLFTKEASRIIDNELNIESPKDERLNIFLKGDSDAR